jgi:hypothetical protein
VVSPWNPQVSDIAVFRPFAADAERGLDSSIAEGFSASPLK